MTFLQPFILWGLPLIFVPVLIHLLNRMRYRSQPWGAMQLLLAATRSSISQARLRQFLVLLFRVLSVAMLLLFLARPIAGGWMGWMVSAAPDVVLILFDRSASMETRLPGAALTQREQAIKLISEAGKQFEGVSRLVLLESAGGEPHEIAGVGSLAGLPLVAPTDTATDIPALMQSALNWLLENRAGTAEIWIASDLQSSNWQPKDVRFKTVVGQLTALPQKIRVRLLALDQPPELNASVRVEEALRRRRGGMADLQFTLELQRRAGNRLATTTMFPLTLILDGAPAQLDVNMDGEAMRWRHRVPLGNKLGGGWGGFLLPADANQRDNDAWFVYGADAPLRAVIVATDAESGAILDLATRVIGGETDSIKALFAPSEFANAPLAQAGLLVWQAPLPDETTADRIRGFVAEGGVVLYLPPGVSDAGRFNGLGWGEVQSAAVEKSFRVARWDELDGPLARTDENLSLPVGEVEFTRRQSLTGSRNTLAAFADAETFLARQTLGRGEILFCTSLPSVEWSGLADGPVLIPMLQRLLQSGSRRLQRASAIECGQLTPADRAATWTCVDSTARKNVQLDAGVYGSGERLLAVNRPVAEDDWSALTADDARALFAGLPIQLWQERGGAAQVLQREVWRLFVVVMLLFLMAESVLVLPPQAKLQAPSNKPQKTPKPQAPIAAAARLLVWCLLVGASMGPGAWSLGFFA